MKINFEKPDVPEYEIAKIVVEGAPRIGDAIEKTTAEVEAVIKRLGAAGESIDEMEQAWESYPAALSRTHPSVLSRVEVRARQEAPERIAGLDALAVAKPQVLTAGGIFVSTSFGLKFKGFRAALMRHIETSHHTKSRGA